MEQCRERDAVSDSGRIFREVVKGRQLGPFEGPQSIKPPALPGDMIDNFFVGLRP